MNKGGSFVSSFASPPMPLKFQYAGTRPNGAFMSCSLTACMSGTYMYSGS